MPVARSPELPMDPVELTNAIPAPIRSYLEQVPSSFAKLDISSGEPLTWLHEFRAFKGIVLAEGWSGLEPWGVWSEGDRAVLYLRNPFASHGGHGSTNEPHELVIDCGGAVSETCPKVTVQFDLGACSKEFIFVWPNITAQINISLPGAFTDTKILRMTLGIRSPHSPYELTEGISLDRRLLGIRIESIRFQPVPSTSALSAEPAKQHPASTATSPAVSPKPELAARVIAVTMAYNEGDMLRRWLTHYGRHLGERNLLVVDHGSDDGSTDHIGAAGRITLPRGPFDDGQRAEFVSGLERSLFHYYDAVVYTDCDEFLVPDPRRFDSLADYVGRMEYDCVRAVALNLVHIRDREEPLRNDQAFLGQRSYCYFCGPECKPLVTRTPVSWHAGFHSCDKVTLLDPNLLLIHAKYSDFDSALARLALTRRMPWSERALHAWGDHQRADDRVLIGAFDMHERFLRQEGDVAIFCPEEVAVRVNTQIAADSSSILNGSYGRLSRVPDWLLGAV